MVVLIVVLVTLVFGCWSYRTGFRRLIAGLHARELAAWNAPSIHRRYARLCEQSELGHLEARDSLTQVVAFTAVETVVELAMIALLPGLLIIMGVAKAMA